MSLTSVWNFQKASEYDQEMPQLETIYQPMASRGRDIEH